ncbi:ANR family transcriptional regulator [Candidatus Providencia siddallii]|uniref:ANR family transcriptional regulator n=1 Tax=Candidatus Providencia siddallii TaxID=1715285 RepID=A0ABM9NPN8_9GAMM
MTILKDDDELYIQKASNAVRLEQSGKYSDAAKAWSQAYLFAQTRSNQVWCEHRSDFCFMQIKRKK